VGVSESVAVGDAVPVAVEDTVNVGETFALGVAEFVGVFEGVLVGVLVGVAGLVMVLVSKVTAPFSAKARPSNVAPVVNVIEA
jgi:hypothetical protein